MLILPIKGKWFNMILSGDKEEWGAEPGTEYYTLHIHEIKERKDC